jgi:hypothetical protein
MGLIKGMEVFAVTVFVSLLFGVLFAILFVAERLQRPGRSLEQDALMPLDDTGIIPPATVGATSSTGGPTRASSSAAVS